ncbi:MAG: hypothetical protein M3460_17725 [Actinomycetota bacterium]|nr:hypothetical protein [Actinomycetota bacterium]
MNLRATAAKSAMLITSLFRAPNPVWTVVLGVLAVSLGVALCVRMVCDRTDRRR